MQYIIPILILFIFFNTLLKVSFWRWWQTLVFSAILGAFVLAVAPYAASQSKLQLDAWLNNPLIMQNAAVIITLEGVLFFGFAFFQLRKILGTKVKQYVMAPLNIYPGLLLFPILFYVLSRLFFGLPGVSFDTVAYTLATAVFVCVPLFSWGLAKLVPEEDLRLELQFITTLFACIIGLIITVNGETAYAPVNQPLNHIALLLALGGFSVLFVSGYFINKFKKVK